MRAPRRSAKALERSLMLPENLLSDLRALERSTRSIAPKSSFSLPPSADSSSSMPLLLLSCQKSVTKALHQSLHSLILNQSSYLPTFKPQTSHQSIILIMKINQHSKFLD